MLDEVKLKQGVELLLQALDLKDELSDTPDRVVRMWKELLSEEEIVTTVCPTYGPLDMVLVRNHVLWSFCPHHLLPVKYTINIGYIPSNNCVLGASKPFRIANSVMRSLRLQEDIPIIIAKKIREAISPRGIGIVLQGEHLCMKMRGVRSECSDMVTPLLLGEMKEDYYRDLFLYSLAH